MEGGASPTGHPHLYPQDAKDDEKSAADEDDVANGLEG